MSCVRALSRLCWYRPFPVSTFLKARRLIVHGDGVQDIALDVEDVTYSFHEAVRRGASAVTPPAALTEDEFIVYECATIRAYGDTTHTFVNRDRYKGVFAPGFRPLDPERYSPTTFNHVGLRAASTTSSAMSRKA